MQTPVAFDRGCYVGTKISEHYFSGIRTCETIFPDGYGSDWHYHQNPHYSHILNGGSKEIRKGDSQWQTQGDGLYYYPGIAHQNIQYRPGTRIFNIEIEENFFKAHDLNLPSEEQMYSDRLKVNGSGLLKILREHYWQDAQTPIAVEQLCLELINGLPPVQRQEPQWTRQILTVLHDRWDLPFSLAELAAEVQIHPVTLSKYFSRYFGCTVGEYIRKIKIDKALVLMRSGELSLTGVAYECGFSDQAHFTKTFTLLTGMLPKQYKGL